MKKKLLLSTIMVLVNSIAVTQTYTEIFEGGWGQGIRNSKPTIVDLDGDGLQDLIIGNYHGHLFHYEQVATGFSTFTLISEKFNGFDVGAQSAPCFLDLDNDGLLDMVVGNVSGMLRHYEQDAASSISFTQISDTLSGIVVGRFPTPAFTDLDSNGLLDLIIGEQDGNLNHYEQSTTGSTDFTLITADFNGIDIGNKSISFFTDLENDGLLDLIIGENVGNLNHYQQDAAASLSFNLITNFFNKIEIGINSAPCFTDLNSDGIMDMIVGEEDGFLNFYEQDAAGSTSFNLISERLLDRIDVGLYSSPFFIDLDNDGLLDLIVGKQDGTLSHFEQDAVASNSFTLFSDTLSAIDVGYYSTPTLTDLDNDGMIDLLIGEQDGNLNHYEQDVPGSGDFTIITDTLNGIDIGYFSAPTFTDLDNDGLLDLFVGKEDGYLNHYEQSTVGSVDFMIITENFNNIDAGGEVSPFFTDLENDGLLDLLIGGRLGEIDHYKQDDVGSSSFTLVDSDFNETDVGRGAKPVFADINGDGLLDFLTGDDGGGIHYFQRNQNTAIEDNSLSGLDPLSFKLFPNYPNPFNPETTIQYYLPQAVTVNISIYNMLGQTIKVLENRFQQAGTHTIQWDGRNEHQFSLASGIYICRIQGGEFNQSIKLMLLRAPLKTQC